MLVCGTLKSVVEYPVLFLCFVLKVLYTSVYSWFDTGIFNTTLRPHSGGYVFASAKPLGSGFVSLVFILWVCRVHLSGVLNRKLDFLVGTEKRSSTVSFLLLFSVSLLLVFSLFVIAAFALFSIDGGKDYAEEGTLLERWIIGIKTVVLISGFNPLAIYHKIRRHLFL